MNGFSQDEVQDETLAKALTGDYDFSIKQIISNAWYKVKGVKGSYWGGLGLYFSIIFGISIVSGIVFALASFFTIPPDALKHGAAQTQHLASLPIGFFIVQFFRVIFELLTITFVTLPMTAGLFLIGLRWVKFKEASAYYVFKLYKKNHLWNLFLMWICMTVIFMVLGFVASATMSALTADALSLPIKALFITISVLCFLGLIYSIVAFMFAFPLVVDRGMKGVQALCSSMKAVTHHWFKVFGLFIITMLFVALSAIPLFIGFIWSFPWAYNALAEAYQSIFGIAGKDPVTLSQS